MGCIALVRCVLLLRCGLAVVVWYPYAGWGTSASTYIWIPHHHSHTTTWHQHTSNQSNTTHEITQQISRKLLTMDVLTSETCWALNSEIIKQVTSSWSLYSTIKVMHSPINIIVQYFQTEIHSTLANWVLYMCWIKS